MSDVKADDFRIINGKDDIINTYCGAKTCTKAGVEIELAFFNPETPGLAPMSVPQNRTVKCAANHALNGEWIRNEPTSDFLEVGSIASLPGYLRDVMDDSNTKIKVLSEKAESVGLKRSYFQGLSHLSAAQLLENIVDVERYQAFFKPPRKDMQDVATYFSVCKSNQVSVSYRDPDHMLDNVRRLYFLTPFLFLLTDNSSAFDEGKPFTGHSGMHHRASLGDSGGVPYYVFSAKNGREYIDAHIDHVMKNPLFVYYNKEGQIERLPSGMWTSFNELKNKGLNTATNYFFAESVLWPDIKIAVLKNDEGDVYNHRFEARMLGVGMHQHQTALLIIAGLAFRPDFDLAVDILLKNFGFDKNAPDQSQKYLKQAYKDAREHNGRFMDIPYGTGEMRDFATQFAEILERTYMTEGFDKELEPILSICRTGCTDAKVNALLFPTLEEIQRHQKHYDARIFDNPNQCAHMVFAKEIQRKTGALCSQGVF